MAVSSRRLLQGSLAFLVALATPLVGWAAAPPAIKPPDAKTAAVIQQKTQTLGQEIDALRGATPEWKLADVEVFHKAAVWIARENEWYKGQDKETVAVLDRGLERAAELKAGQAPWLKRQGAEFRGYRSAVDGSIQPYQVVLPRDYPGKGKLWRLDVVLHGRDSVISEIKFMRGGDSTKPAPEQNYIELHVFGRGNNAFRWSGESDVFEALAAFRAEERHVQGREMVDDNRIVLRGFSMGGAGAWHLGLHYPSFWCSVSPGAGFTTTFGRVKNPDGKLPDYTVKCLGVYDALDFAENVYDVPVVAYDGELDSQREAMESIRDKITPLGLHATFIVGPHLKHKYAPESLKEIMRLQGEQAAAGRPAYPHVRFVTTTPRYSKCYWITVLRQEHQYDRSLADGQREGDALKLKTENVQALELTLPPQWNDHSQIAVDIDGAALQVKPAGSTTVILDKESGAWSQADAFKWRAAAAEGRWKTPGLTGPIDDAFTTSFLCVRGTGNPWHADVQHHADLELARFASEWQTWLRGVLPVKNDTDVTADDLAHKNLILFGDPASNSLIAKALPRLPIHWTSDALVMDHQTYPAADHLPALIYPSPFGAGHYVVLNSGHTFHAADFRNTNRMLYPHMGDWGVLEVTPNEKDAYAAKVLTAGLFNEEWGWAPAAK